MFTKFIWLSITIGKENNVVCRTFWYKNVYYDFFTADLGYMYYILNIYSWDNDINTFLTLGDTTVFKKLFNAILLYCKVHIYLLFWENLCNVTFSTIIKIRTSWNWKQTIKKSFILPSLNAESLYTILYNIHILCLFGGFIASSRFVISIHILNWYKAGSFLGNISHICFVMNNKNLHVHSK